MNLSCTFGTVLPCSRMIVLLTDCTCCVCPLTLMNLSVVRPAPSIYATLSMFSACSCGCHFAVLLSLLSVTHQSCVCHRTCIKSCFTFGCYKLKQTRFTDVLESNISGKTDKRLAVKEFAHGYGTCSCLIHILSSSNVNNE